LLFPINPLVGPSVLVGYRDDENMIRFHGVQKFEGKIVKKALPDVTTFHGPRLRIGRDSQGGLFDFLLEFLIGKPRENNAHHSLNISSIGTPSSLPSR
jgi:hypothetical protein